MQLNVLLPEAVEAAVKVHLQRRVPLRHARLRVQTFTLIIQGTGFAIAAADAATEVELAADVLTKFAPTAGVVGSQLAAPPRCSGHDASAQSPAARAVRRWTPRRTWSSRRRC